MTKTFIDNCLTVNDRVLAVPRCRRVVFKGEEVFTPQDNPFDTVNKLHILVTKAQTEEKILWCLEAIIDGVQSRAFHADDVTGRQLKGAEGGKGLIDQLLLTRDLWVRLTTETIHTNGWKSADIEVLLTVLGSPEAYYKAHGKDDNLMWQKGWPESLIRFYELLEEFADVELMRDVGLTCVCCKMCV
eukprot:14542368-Alexandrium_andersonii.AAC.1